MAEITVRAETTVLGMRPGDVQTVEDSPFLRNVVAGGRLSIVAPSSDTTASQPAPEQAAVKRRARPAADAEALVVLRPPPPEAA